MSGRANELEEPRHRPAQPYRAALLVRLYSRLLKEASLGLLAVEAGAAQATMNGCVGGLWVALVLGSQERSVW
jgi:hypothetical protein